MERIVKDSVQIRFVYGSAAGCSASARKGRRFFGRRQEETGGDRGRFCVSCFPGEKETQNCPNGI